jgi:hypothetical protein
MIPVVNPIKEPEGFDANCRIPGAAWLAANPTNNCHDACHLWLPFRPALRRGFSRRCGYLAIKLHVGGVVDHLVSCNEDRTKAFEWPNYRYASENVNSRKQALDRKKIKVLDPFTVKAGWFRVILPSFELVITDAVDPGLRQLAQFTIRELGLDKGHEAIEARWSAYESHWNDGEIDLVGLRRDAPLIAEAVEARRREGKPLPDPKDSPEPPHVALRKRPYAPHKRSKRPT